MKTNQKTLKNQNTVSLLLVLMANLVILIILVKTNNFYSKDVQEFIKQWKDFLPATCGITLVGLVNGFFSSDAKARLIFWRWRHPLPGSFAFSRYAPKDPRIDVIELEKKVGRFPSDPRDQNTLWYKLYQSVSNNSVVIDTHKHFLFARDYTAIAFLFLLIAGPIGVWQISSGLIAASYIVGLVVQYLIARQAAENYGIRLVRTVLAIKTVS